MTASLFVATPLHDARMGYAYSHGVFSLLQRGLLGEWKCINGTGLMRQRDRLVAEFVKSKCTHLLFVDSDIGWTPEDAEKLLDTGRDFVAGCYAKKTLQLPVVGLLTGHREGELYEAAHVGTGLLLVSRAAIERMLEHRREFTYESGGERFTSLCHQDIHEGTEDLAFCRVWRECGGQVWLHSGVVVLHYDGNTPYVPNMRELREPIEAERIATAAE
jgi:hypothetical protein